MRFARGLRAGFDARLARWVRQRQGVDVFPVRLAGRRIYILPTRAGVAFAGLLFFMLLAGLNYANNLALFATFLLAGFALVAMHLCQRNLLGATIAAVSAEPAFAGGSAHIRLAVENPDAEMRYAWRAVLGDDISESINLPAHGPAALSLSVPAPRRGRMHIPRIEIQTSHPFGLFRAWTWLHVPLSVLVYPAARGARAPPHGGSAEAGERALSIVGDDEWQELRAYRDGDSPRRVAWKAFARGGGPLLVKDYVATGGATLVFEFDALTRLPVEARLEQLTRWIIDAEQRAERYGLRLPRAYLPPSLGAAHRERCLAALAVYGLREDPA